jgi:hypothetical protein
LAVSSSNTLYIMLAHTLQLLAVGLIGLMVAPCHSLVANPNSQLETDRLEQRAAPSPSFPSLLSNATASEVEVARQIVEDAISRMRQLNKARIEKPARNQYRLKPSSKSFDPARDPAVASPPPLLEISDKIASAAALIAEIETAKSSDNLPQAARKRAAIFWMETLERNGTVPWGKDPSYKVNILIFRTLAKSTCD